MRTQARRAPEFRGEMHAGEAGASHCEGFEGETNRDAIYVARGGIDAPRFSRAEYAAV
jgi:hypothetical protein